jgi:hypothetical protein
MTTAEEKIFRERRSGRKIMEFKNKSFIYPQIF